MNKTWLEVFNEHITYAIEIQCMPNSKTCYESYLKDNGFEYHGISNKKGSKRPTVESSIKEHKAGTFFLNVANHVVSVVDGIYYDTWDSGQCCLYGYYEKEK